MTLSPQQIAEELKRTAKELTPYDHWGSKVRADRAYEAACSPDRILVLVEDWERLQQEVTELRRKPLIRQYTTNEECGQHESDIKEFADTTLYLKAENDKLRAAAKDVLEIITSSGNEEIYNWGRPLREIRAKLREAGIE